jgi:hypothetical protein
VPIAADLHAGGAGSRATDDGRTRYGRCCSRPTVQRATHTNQERIPTWLKAPQAHEGSRRRDFLNGSSFVVRLH